MITTVATGIGAFGSRWSLECDGMGEGGGWSVTRKNLTTTTRYFDSEGEAREYFDTYTTPIVEVTPGQVAAVFERLSQAAKAGTAPALLDVEFADRMAADMRKGGR